MSRVCFSQISPSLAAMRDNEGYVILHKGVPRTFRDNRQSKAEGEIIEIVERSAGTKLIMLKDGRTG